MPLEIAAHDAPVTWPVPIIDQMRCTGCGLCVAACPSDALTMLGKAALVAHPAKCAYHGACEVICPTQAITRPLQIIFVTEEKNAMTTLVYPDWKTKVVYSAAGPQPQVLVENEKTKVIVAGLMAGQKIPVHPESFGVYYFLEGVGTMIVDGERLAIAPGVIIITPAGAQRGMEADTALAFLATRVA